MSAPSIESSGFNSSNAACWPLAPSASHARSIGPVTDINRSSGKSRADAKAASNLPARAWSWISATLINADLKPASCMRLAKATASAMRLSLSSANSVFCASVGSLSSSPSAMVSRSAAVPMSRSSKAVRPAR